MFDLPPRVLVFLTAMLPFSELRGAIPLAISKYGINPYEAYILGVMGNLVFDRFFDHLFHRTHKKHSERIDKYGALGLVTFVAIPLPLTGAWTGVAAAYVFELPKRYAFPAIVLGVLLAGVVVTLITLGVLNGMGA
jgi:uncharacterized membrane protein